jgi:hypothetical protein
MQITETKTAEGSGFWGYGVYEIELRTRSTTYTDSGRKNPRTVHRYDLRFHNGSQSDIRAFASQTKRAEFMDKSFTDLKVREIPRSDQESTPLSCPLADVVGEYLSDVTFVMDYLQMRFCGASFNFYNWPVVILPDRRFEVSEIGYRDALCGLIGKTVQSLDVFLDTGLTFKFEGSETVTVSLRAPAGSTLPEVAEYSSGNKSGIMWMSDEEPFA